MKRSIQQVLALAALTAAASASAQITLYQGEGFRGRAYSTAGEVRDLGRLGRDSLDDRASSIVVERGRWEVCEQPRFRGRCVVLRRGSYDSLTRLGMENRISSLRPADERRRYEHEAEAPMERPDYAWRRRANERVYEAPVSAVRAVMGPPTQRCWTERQQVGTTSGPSVGGAIAGAVIGGILGHQVGGGSGKNIATAGGAVAGAMIGSSVAGGNVRPITQDVQRCQSSVGGTPAYYDVTYSFRGRAHQVQMSAPPAGRTIIVNANGEPRQ
jgi:uncharacterized protein YcfJ